MVLWCSKGEKSMKNWLAIGPPNNWKIGIKGKIWAVSPAQAKTWEKLEKDDRVFFYATAPVKGLIGYGVVEKTSADEQPFWPQEREKNQVLWPFRIRFSEVKAVPEPDWQAQSVTPERKGIVFQRAFQPVVASNWARNLDSMV
jgi:predicted RNA-binding protein